jgi:hypothetical protein
MRARRDSNPRPPGSKKRIQVRHLRQKQAFPHSPLCHRFPRYRRLRPGVPAEMKKHTGNTDFSRLNHAAPVPADYVSGGAFRMLILRAARRVLFRYSRYGASTVSIQFMNARTRRDRLCRCATTRDTANDRRRKSGRISTSAPLSKYRPIPRSGA